MGTWLEERRKQKEEAAANNSTSTSTSTPSNIGGSSWLQNRRLERSKAVAEEIQNRLNSWNENVQGLYSDYNSRYEGDTGTSRAYRSDYSDWLDNVNKRSSAFDEDYNYISSALREYGDYLDPEWVSEVSNYLKDTNKGIRSIKSTARQDYDIFSQFEDENTYNTWAQQNEWKNKYAGVDYFKAQDVLKELDPESEEYKWLSDYAQSEDAMSVDVLDRLISDAESKRDWYYNNNERKETYTEDGYYTIEDKYAKEINDIDSQIEQFKAQRWRLENRDKYSSLAENEDFNAVSSAVDKSINNYDYNYINNIDGFRKTESARGMISGGNDATRTFDYMTDDEVKTYNYLYNKEGKKAANEYLDYLSYDLNARATDENKRLMSEFADKLPVTASAISVPANLMSGVGYLDVARQKIARDISGEYRPIDYNTIAMSPSNASTAIRGTVAQNIADSTGTIQLDRSKNPFLAQILNGKSLGDVYQLGMSMVDSAAIIPFGTAGTFLLGGSAASQGTLEALERGATDSQALTMGLLNGAFETLFERVSLDNLLRGNSKNVVTAFFKQGFIEGTEEFNTTLANNIADILVMAEKSDYKKNISAYMASGLSEEEATKQSLLDMCIEMGWDFVGGVVSGGVMGSAAAPIQNKMQKNADAKAMYGSSLEELVAEALELNPDSGLAKRTQDKLTAGKEISGVTINRLVDQNNKAIIKQDVGAISTAAETRLSELGETGDVAAIASALAKEVSGEKLSRKEAEIISSSKYGQRVRNELNPENIRSGDYSSAWAEKIDTSKLNAEEYSRLLNEAETAAEAQTTENGQVIAEDAKTAPIAENGEILNNTQPETEATPKTAKNTPVNVLSNEAYNAAQVEDVAPSEARIEDIAEKYGAQSTAFVRNYNQGQDVEIYDMGFEYAYNQGKSGVPFSTVLENAHNSSVLSQLTDAQLDIAYNIGADVAKTEASEQHKKIISGANGKTGRRKGVVRGQDVSISDLRKTFNDKQNVAYKLLSSYAEVTGIDIVLYKADDVNDKGEYTDTQGKFKRSEDTIYININAGLFDKNDVDNLSKYTMLRTFSHEFVHFIEKYNPVEYNEFRRFVFEKLTERGENVNDLIEEQMALSEGLTYEKASREVVAEAMTDILPDSNIMQDLAENHQNIFKELLAKLKEFIETLKQHFKGYVANSAREANALKEEVNGTIKYLDDIVSAYDKLAKNALNNYQATVAIDEVTTETVETKAETQPVEESKQAEPKTDTSEHGFTVTDNAEYGSLEISFKSKPSEAIRNVLKENKFRWHNKKSVWYGKGERANIIDTLNAAYEAEAKPSDFEKAFKNATQEERDEVVEAIHENTKISHVAPTEIRSSATASETINAQNIEEVNENGENADNNGTVRSVITDRQGDTPVLDESEAENVQGNVEERDVVGDTSQRGRETGRNDNRPDAERVSRGPSEGDSESRVHRGNDVLTEASETEQQEETQPEAETESPTLHEVVTEQIEQKSTEQPKGSNFVIGESLELPSGEKARYKANVDAIRLIKQLEAEGRYATAAEQTILSKYVGWGGLANAFDMRKSDWAKEYAELKELLTDEEYSLARGSTLNAHYTDVAVIKAMYDGLKQLGFTGGRMLEPSSGTGNFVGAMPTDMSSTVKSWTMVELDSITGRIAKYLYPNADVRIQGFEKANIPNDYMDVAISNVPFGNYAITDKAYPKKVTSAIHNYFFAKSLDKVRPGGIVMFITSSYTMNSKDSTVRKYIMQHADLLGAIRLPDTAFKGNAGTEVVTDIIVLKKRAANTNYEGENFEIADWQNVDNGNGTYINNYFKEHPEMVLGTATMTGGMYRGGSLTYKAFTDRGSLEDQIRKAFENIQGKMEYPAQRTPEKSNFAVEKATKKAKNDNYVVKDGKVYKYQDGDLIEQTVSTKAAEKIKGLLDIRDAHRELATALQQGQNENSVKAARKALNKAYDDFVKKHGYINAPGNKSVLNGDPDKYSILSLENYDSEKKVGKKADIFTTNTIAPNRTVTQADSVEEGLIVSRNETGGVDVARIAQLTGKTAEEVTRELIDTRLAFKNRNGELEAAEVYLSGNVRAKLREAEGIVPIDKDYQNNIEALKNVIPEDVAYQDIFCNPGTPWIPDTVYSDFAAYMLGTRNTDWSKAVEITRNNETGNFVVELKNNYLKSNSYNTQKWGTPQRSFLKLFEAMLNSKSVVIKYKTDDGQTIIDKDATAAANEKIENITKEFQDWIWRDETRKTELSTLYNEVFNSIVTPKYNGDNLTVDGANAMKPLREHQRNAVQRVISSGGNTLLAHKVGAGKTYEMAAAAMKLKQLGLVKKPMFVVPKSLVEQWGIEFLDFFPTAKLLVTDASEFSAANRKVYANRIANGNFDAVIVSYEQFERLPMSAEYERQFYEEEMNSVIAAIQAAKEEKGEKSMSIKDLEKKRKSLQAKIDKLTDVAKDENNIEFEQLGIDSIFVDEAHNFKNLFYTTSMTNVSGLGNKDGSKRAFDLYMKVRYLQQLNGGRGVVFATATPVMNSMSEMYIMQKYLQPDLLKQLGLSTFDAWAKQFGEVVNGVEIKPSGQGYRVKQSFSRFKNMSELQLLFRNFADVLTDIPGLKIPKMKGGKVNVVVCEPGQYQQDYMKELEERADNIKNVDPSVDNMLKITSDGRKISYTQRMIDPSLPYEEGCKLYRCADNVIQNYKDSKDIKGTQLIFMDMATPKGTSKNSTETEDTEMDMESAKLYDDLKARLVKSGIPSKEIAFIHDADTADKKKKLFADVNDGKVRVLIGSTGKMGVGMNAQKRVVAIHHLDAPWRPGDVEQRNGRAFRQGNINDEVSCYTYVTEGSFDARLWDILDRKSQFINQVMNGENVGRETEDTGEVTLSAAEVKALASGSPLILEQVQLETDIKKLESLRRSHNSAIIQAKEKLATDEALIAEYTKRIENGKIDAASIVDTYSTEKKFSLTVGKTAIKDKKTAGIALMTEAQAKATTDGYTTIGKFAGFDLRVVKTHEGIKGLVSGKQSYSFKLYPDNTTFMITQLTSVIESIPSMVESLGEELKATQADIVEQKKLIAEPFAKQAELDQKRSRYNEVMDILNPKEEQSLDNIAEEDVQNQARRRTDDDTNISVARQNQLRTKKPIQLSREDYAKVASNRTQKYAGLTDEDIPEIDFVKLGEYGKVNEGYVYAFRNIDSNNFIPLAKWAIKPRRIETTKEERTSYEETNSKTDRNGLQGRLYSGDNLGIRDRGAGTENAELVNRSAESYRGRNIDDDASYIGRDITDDQNQERRKTYTDREVLAIAAERISEFENLTEGQRDALQILKKRLDRLEELEVRRTELGQQYREQQFGAKVDRAKASETLKMLNEHKTMIEQAENDVLKAEDTEVLKRTLKVARKFVENQEKEAGQEMLRRYRERRDNAAAVKKYRTRIKADVDTLTKWILHPSNKDVLKHVPDALKTSVIPFLSSIDFTSKRMLAGGEATQADQAFMKQLKSLRNALNENFNASGAYSGYNDLPPEFMENLQRFIDTAQTIVDNNKGTYVINEMTAEELKSLSKLVRTLKKFITQMNRFHANAMFEHVYEAGDSSIEFMNKLDTAKHTGLISDFTLWQQMRPAYAFERFGEGGMAIYDGLRKGQATLAFNTKKIIDFADKAYTEAEVKAWEKETKTFRLGGDTVVMPISHIMSFYELSKRPQALGHILGAGVRVATVEVKDGKKKKKVYDTGHTLTEKDIEVIVKALTPRQKAVADSMQQFMAKQGGAWGNYVSLRRFGEEMFGEEHYFPINSDGQRLQAEAEKHPTATSLYALLNMSFTKELQEKANNRIILYSIFDVFANHMSSMAQYNAFALPILDALKWFNYQTVEMDSEGNKSITGSVREEMARAFGVPVSEGGKEGMSYAERFVMHILQAFNGTEAQGSPKDSLGVGMLHRYNISQVAYNLRVVVQQPLAIARAGLLIDYKSIAKGLKLSPSAIKTNIEEMQKYSGIAAWKALGFYDINISRGVTQLIKHDESFMDKVTDVGMWGAEKADTLTWSAIWSACKEEVIRKQHLKPSSAGFYEAVSALFEDVIYKTQVVDSVLTKNEWIRDKGYVARTLGAFMSEPTTTASMLIDTFDKYVMDIKRGLTSRDAWRKNSKKIGRVATVYAVSQILLAAVQSVIDAFRDDDDYENYWEKYLEALKGNLIDELNPFSKLPILSDLVELIKSVAELLGADTYGNTSNSTAAQLIDYTIKGSEIILDKIKGEDTNYTWYGGIYKLLQATSGATGLPIGTATREIITAWNSTAGYLAPSLKVKTYEPTEKSNIKYAFEDGYLTQEEAIANLVETGAVDDRNEAYWTVQGWASDNPNFSKYSNLYDAVLGNGNYNKAVNELKAHGSTEKEILQTIRSRITKWYRDGNISRSQAIRMYVNYCDMTEQEAIEKVDDKN